MASSDAVEWRLDHIAQYVKARAEWLHDRADLILDVSRLTPDESAHAVAEAVAQRQP